MKNDSIKEYKYLKFFQLVCKGKKYIYIFYIMYKCYYNLNMRFIKIFKKVINKKGEK